MTLLFASNWRLESENSQINQHFIANFSEMW